MRCNWNSDHDWDPEANVVDVLYTQRYRTIVGDNVPEEVLGVFIETVTDDNEGGDVIMDNHTYVEGFCEDCNAAGPAYHWCAVCQDGSLHLPKPQEFTTVSVGSCASCGTSGAFGAKCRMPCCNKSYSVDWYPCVMNIVDTEPRTSAKSNPSEVYLRVSSKSDCIDKG